jgi:ETS translocation variant 6/7
MKVQPLQLPTMERMPLQLPFSPSDLLWRYPLGFHHAAQQPSSPIVDYKSHLPVSLQSDPRIWSREDVAAFLKWCETEFDVPNFDMEMFQMNGKL